MVVYMMIFVVVNA